MPLFRDLTGQRFGKLTVVAFSHQQKKMARWICHCDCGNTKTICMSHLTRFDSPTRSCGCSRLELWKQTMINKLVK